MQRDADAGKGFVTLNIIWFAMLLSLLIYLILGIFAGEKIQIPMDAGTLDTLKSVFYVLGFITFAGTRYLRNLLLRGNNSIKPAFPSAGSPAPAVGKYTMVSIITWAMCESIAVYGLVLFLLGKNAADLYLFIGVSALGLLFYRPRRDEMIQSSQGGFE